MSDLINRQDAIDAIDELKIRYFDRKVILAKAQDAVNNVPSAQKKVEWKFWERREPQYDIEGVKTWANNYLCSECGFVHHVIENFGHYSYCPNCGADMRGGTK